MKLLVFISVALFGASVRSNEDCPTACEECFCTEDPDGYLEIDCEDYREEAFPQCITHKVRSVSITRSEITKLSPQDFVNATALEVLRISESPRLTVIEDGTFEETTSLQEISITNCGLYSLPDELSRGLVNLTVLDLEHNAIKVLPYSWFDGTAIENLYLDDNRLDFLPQGLFDNLPTLQILNLESNDMMELPVSTLKKATSLTHLWLSQNPF
ncbi:hypothetical protein CAPTEDRAFT_133533, partial [Capitella teleta]